MDEPTTRLHGGQILTRSRQIYRSNLGLLLAFSLFYIIPRLLASTAWCLAGDKITAWAELLLEFLAFLGLIYAFIGISRTVAAIDRGESMSFTALPKVAPRLIIRVAACNSGTASWPFFLC